MKVLKKDMKHGKIRFCIDHELDLWNLYKIIKEGDQIEGTTFRKLVIDHNGRKEIVKKKVFLKIKVEKVSLEQGNLKVLGRIIEAPEDIPLGNYHSFNIRKGDVVTIIKESWKPFLSLIEEISKIKPYFFLAVAFDRHKVAMAKIENNGYKLLGEWCFPSFPKEQGELSKIYNELFKKILEEYNKFNYDGLIIGSPGFFKDYIYESLPGEIKSKAIAINISYGGIDGIREIIKNRYVSKALSKLKFIRDLHLVEELKKEISKGNATYGFKQVTKALEYGAAKILMISETIFNKSSIVEVDVNKLFSLAEKTGCKVFIINSQDLDALGGVACILRYKIEI